MGSGDQGTRVGTREAPAAAAPGNPPALRPAAAAPARLMRQEQEEAPRERRGDPGGRRGRGRPGGGVGRGGSPGRRRAEGRGLGVGRGCLCPCPRWLPGRRFSYSLRPRVLLPLRGAAGRPRRALLPSNAHSRLTLSHTHAHTHSFTHSLSHTLKQKGSPAQQPVPPQREEEGGDSRNTAAAVAKTSRRLGLPPTLPPAHSAAAVCPSQSWHPEDHVEGTG